MIREIPGPAGRLEALLDDPAWNCHIGPVRSGGAAPIIDPLLEEPPRVAVVLGHPLPTGGGTMHNKVVYQIAKGLCRTRAAVLRFNFRGVGTSQGAFDEGPGEMADFRAAIDFMAGRYPGVEIWAGGFSFGAWVAMTVGASDERVSALLGVAPPVGRYDFSAIIDSDKPKFFVQGDRDELCLLRDLKVAYGRMREPKDLVVIEGADHLFDGHTNAVAGAVEDLLGDFRAGTGDPGPGTGKTQSPIPNPQSPARRP